MKRVDLGQYSNIWYRPGGKVRRIIWYLINILFKSSIPYLYKSKVLLLKWFGAKIGEGVIIKPCVNIKYPWFLELGDNVWIGENVWIDNLTHVKIGNNVCISQGASIFTGNHNYKKQTFDLIIDPVIIEDGVWICAKATICPGVTLKSHSIITVGTIVTRDTQPYKIYRGLPAVPYKDRIIE
jgi:putative colanic acid biosynthesis acetyltransferase WcaF